MKNKNMTAIRRICGDGILISLILFSYCLSLSAQAVPAEVIRSYLWPASEEDSQKARETVRALEVNPLSRAELTRIEVVLRGGPQTLLPLPPAPGPDEPVRIQVSSSNGSFPVLLDLPPGYSSDREWPLMVAMHGGPPGTREQAERGAGRMLSVWAEAAAQQGWIVAAPAMVSAVSADEFTPERLPYEIFHPEDFRSLVARLSKYVRIDPNRVVSTGISLGSNFSIAFAAAHPDWLSAIVPVSTEGESRQRLLKNLFAVPTYVLEGAQDKNIRTISGPRAMESILAREAYDFAYLEMSDRAHEGFAEFYPDVLRWLSSRPRRVYPRWVLRSPHDGIVPVARKLYWIESGDAEGLVQAEVTSSNQIEVQAHNTQSVVLLLHDRLVNLDAPVRVTINGIMVYDAPALRSLTTLLEEVRNTGDRARVFPVRLHLKVPEDPTSRVRAEQFRDSLRPDIPEGQLSFWEMYAARALEERVPSLGLEASRESLPAALDPYPGQQGLLVRKLLPNGLLTGSDLREGDLIIRFGQHHFFSDQSQELLFSLRRELRSHPIAFPVRVWREGKALELELSLALGAYARTR